MKEFIKLDDGDFSELLESNIDHELKTIIEIGKSFYNEAFYTVGKILDIEEYLVERAEFGEIIYVADLDLYTMLEEDDLPMLLRGWEDQEQFNSDFGPPWPLIGYGGFDTKDLVDRFYPGDDFEEMNSTISDAWWRDIGWSHYKSTRNHTPVKPPVIKKVFDRFTKLPKSEKKIIFDLNLSKEFEEVFKAADGKEVMFFGVIEEDDENIYNVKSIDFPPQKNFGAYVETVDGEYEKWAFERVLEGKKFLLHVHTHPNFSAFSSGTDERQMNQYIKDAEGNPFVVQLIVSNPRLNNYFIRWFNLEDDTFEEPEVTFTFESNKKMIEEKYPGIFRFNSKRSELDDINYVLGEKEKIAREAEAARLAKEAENKEKGI